MCFTLKIPYRKLIDVFSWRLLSEVSATSPHLNKFLYGSFVWTHRTRLTSGVSIISRRAFRPSRSSPLNSLKLFTSGAPFARLTASSGWEKTLDQAGRLLLGLSLKTPWTSFVLRVTCHIWWQSLSCCWRCGGPNLVLVGWQWLWYHLHFNSFASGWFSRSPQTQGDNMHSKVLLNTT